MNPPARLSLASSALRPWPIRSRFFLFSVLLYYAYYSLACALKKKEPVEEEKTRHVHASTSTLEHKRIASESIRKYRPR